MNIDLNPIMSFCNAIGQYIVSGLEWLLNGVVKVIWGVLYTVLDGVLTVITGFVSLIDLSTILLQITGSWVLLPSQIVWFITQMGLAPALSIIGYAIIIRMMLNLIPGTFTRI